MVLRSGRCVGDNSRHNCPTCCARLRRRASEFPLPQPRLPSMFNKAVDKWSPVLEEGRVYVFSAGRLRGANPQHWGHAHKLVPAHPPTHPPTPP